MHTLYIKNNIRKYFNFNLKLKNIYRDIYSNLLFCVLIASKICIFLEHKMTLFQLWMITSSEEKKMLCYKL